MTGVSKCRRKAAGTIALITALVVSTPLHALSPRGKFDIICRIHGRTIVDYKRAENEVPGRIGPSRWADNRRFVIDLDRRIYWGTAWITPSTSKVVVVTKDQIYFGRSRDSFERFSIKTGRFEAWARGGGYMDETESGHCRLAKFSGFPAVPARKAGQK